MFKFDFICFFLIENSFISGAHRRRRRVRRRRLFRHH
jgi:hypothetical protein